MLKTKQRVQLSQLFPPSPHTKIAIDHEVETDANGNFLVHVGYLRVSTDKQADQGFGLDIQERDVVNYCQKNDVPNLILFIDDGYTGTKMDRPALQAVIGYINQFNDGNSKIRIESFIVPRIDRLARNLLGTLQFIQDYIVSSNDVTLTSSGNGKKKRKAPSVINRNKEAINFISVAESMCRINRNDSQSKFLLALFASLAEFDRDQIVNKLERGRVQRVSSGLWPGGGNIPYGYRYNRDLGKLEVIPEQADKIREIFRLYMEEKVAPQKIADRLGFKGDRVVTQILKRKSLTGCIVYKGQEYKDAHEAIISLEQWQEAQEEIKRRGVFRSESHYMLSGLLYCGVCGAKMRYQKWGKSGKCKLVCYSHQKPKPSLVKDENCDNQLFWAEEIEEAVKAQLFRLCYLGNQENTMSPSNIDLAASLKQQLQGENRKLSKLYDLYAEADDMEDHTLRQKIDECKKRIQGIREQMTSAEAQTVMMHHLEKTKNILRNLESTWPHMTEKERQTVCRELLHKVILQKNGTIDLQLNLHSYLRVT